jgi:RNA-directed DNA polymerase
MTADRTAGAASRETVDWQHAHRIVRRLQARIVKARQAGRWGKVKALQRLLTRSLSARVLAVKRVTENPGKRTPGIDGELWDTPAKKAQAVNKLRHHGYRPLPIRRVHIPKPKGKTRPLGILTMTDRAMRSTRSLNAKQTLTPTGFVAHGAPPMRLDSAIPYWLTGPAHALCSKAISNLALTRSATNGC